MKKILIALSLLLLISCHSKDHKMENAVYDEDGYPLAKRDVSLYKANPDAKQAYKVKVEIKDAPGPLKLQKIMVSYQADNCRFTSNRFAGTTGSPNTSLNIDYHRIDEHTYEGIIHLDGMLDEDYYGQGVCHWDFLSTKAIFKATGAEEETWFSIRADKDEIEAKKNIKRYFAKRRYPVTIKNDGIIFENYPDSGLKESELSSQIPENQWFSMTMTVEGAE